MKNLKFLMKRIIILKISFFWVNIKKFENIEINGHQLSLTKGKCWTVPSTCVRNSNNLKISKKIYIFTLRINEKNSTSIYNYIFL